jgi:hypothetical protein
MKLRVDDSLHQQCPVVDECPIVDGRFVGIFGAPTLWGFVSLRDEFDLAFKNGREPRRWRRSKVESGRRMVRRR